ncbi:MAG: isochorismatase family protein [Alphaproteobacteria bacterium]
MGETRTLLQMAGADLRPPPLRDVAVVVIDAQREYLDGQLPLAGIAPALDAVARLLARARAAGAPVVHVAHLGRPGGLFDPDGPGGQIAAPARPEPTETVVTKRLPNAFADTELGDVIAAGGRKIILLAGFMTHMCVSSTARAALDLGLRAVVLSDATATRSLPDPTGRAVIDAEIVHRAALAELADRFAIVTPLAQVPD